jgi:hypothetical protein
VAEIPSNKIELYFNKQLIYRLDEITSLLSIRYQTTMKAKTRIPKKELFKITNAIDNLRVVITGSQNTPNDIDVNGAMKSHLGLLQTWTRAINTHLSGSPCALPEGAPSLSDEDAEIGKLILKLEELFEHTLKDTMSAALREWDEKWAIPKGRATGTWVTTIITEDKIEQQKWIRSMILQTLEKLYKQRREEKDAARGEKEGREADNFVSILPIVMKTCLLMTIKYYRVVKLIKQGREGVLGFWMELSPIVAVKLLPCWVAADNGYGLNWWLWEGVLVSLGYAAIPFIYVWIETLRHSWQ